MLDRGDLWELGDLVDDLEQRMLQREVGPGPFRKDEPQHPLPLVPRRRAPEVVDPQEAARVDLGDGVVVVGVPGRGLAVVHLDGEKDPGSHDGGADDQTVADGGFHDRGMIAKVCRLGHGRGIFPALVIRIPRDRARAPYMAPLQNLGVIAQGHPVCSNSGGGKPRPYDCPGKQGSISSR